MAVRRREALSAEGGDDRQGAKEEKVTPEDAEGVCPSDTRRGATPSGVRLVDHIVVEEGCAVGQLGDLREGDGLSLFDPHGAADDEAREGPEAFSASGEEIGA